MKLTPEQIAQLRRDHERWRTLPLHAITAQAQLDRAQDAMPTLLDAYEGKVCPRCHRAYRFEEETANRLCAPCTLEIHGMLADHASTTREERDQLRTELAQARELYLKVSTFNSATRAIAELFERDEHDQEVTEREAPRG